MTAEEVVERLTATASPARGGPRSDEYGFGEIDPFRAVNDGFTGGRPQPAEPLAAAGDNAAATRDQARRNRAWRVAAVAIAVALGLAVAVLAVVWVVPRGRRRRWQPGRVLLPGESYEADAAATFAWSLGPPPALAHPDRAVDEELVRQIRSRRARMSRPEPPT
jgi:hypothetical protein